MPSSWGISSALTNGPTITAKVNNALSKVGTDNYTDFYQLLIRIPNENSIYKEWTSSETIEFSTINIVNGYFQTGGTVGSVIFGYNSESHRHSAPLPVRPFLAF